MRQNGSREATPNLAEASPLCLVCLGNPMKLRNHSPLDVSLFETPLSSFSLSLATLRRPSRTEAVVYHQQEAQQSQLPNAGKCPLLPLATKQLALSSVKVCEINRSMLSSALHSCLASSRARLSKMNSGTQPISKSSF